MINITSNGIKEAIDNLLNENELLQDKVYKLESIIKEVRELLNQEWYSVLRKGTIRKVREILDKENNNE